MRQMQALATSDCALYNDELDSDKEKEYICPICRIDEKEIGQRSIPTAAKNLPKLSLVII